jgi:hypothetical protein
MRWAFLFCLGAVGSFLGSAFASDTATLGSLRNHYLGQTLIVRGPTIELQGEKYLLGWNAAVVAGNRYKALGIIDHLPYTYFGKSAKVIAVQINEIKLKPQTDAFGEPVSDDNISNPYADIVVQFDDGRLAMTTNYSSTLDEDLELASTHKGEEDEMTTALPQVIGKKLYAAGFSVRYQPLFEPETSLDEMLKTAIVSDALLHIGDGRIPATNIPLLEPLTIIAAKYIPDKQGAVLKMRLPNGKEVVTFVDHNNLKKQTQGRHDCKVPPCQLEDKPFFERVAGAYLTSIPSDFTPREISAIRRGDLFIGMSKEAVEFSGLASFTDEKENDWGRGGKQMIFGDSVFVYVDNHGKVVDWHLLSK